MCTLYISSDSLHRKRLISCLQEIVFFEEGEPLVDGEAGDLRFHVVTKPHAKFQRDRHDLKCNLTISLMDALVGFSREVCCPCSLTDTRDSPPTSTHSICSGMQPPISLHCDTTDM